METRFHSAEQAEPQVPIVVCDGRKGTGKNSVHVLCKGRIHVSSSVFEAEIVLYRSLYWQFGCITMGQLSERGFQQDTPTNLAQKCPAMHLAIG